MSFYIEKAISIARFISLPLKAPNCFKIRELEKNWAKLTKDKREPISMYQEKKELLP
ncbi:hypothetical protein C2G38_2195341 [Gigaspora rosea]|uniref:Uncharacterized protein n=1 Tax=Gigaspora rosea TaxID=44941 RepID=A0A397UXA1_9GLOM|nr:hypothetical protein C2G38_2195341 [Gigaspora rosea]